ncbi:carboxypeptidase regulatory-like domain-containing protein [Fimbriiglobus ruber]|uniref:Carboxypeptidase regulatory-like domain-containing protein n=1 Tax=Fimbriiglobus ruber TaxID=1908690 RepID=A0A225DQY0_9BACT|nr:carboxypeptidase regulatory-like domain-containing protein [Fimbriiglobus ruber]OWK43701.1 hypothetical protein FRUB_03300 [Fimbriiglobus ruber]
MRSVLGVVLFGGLVVVSAGCGSSEGGQALDMVPVSGNITVNGNPTGNVELTFWPQADTKGQGGAGSTDSTGRYEVASPQGKKGLPPGKYKVVASRRLNPDGSPPDPKTPPIESNARETLPSKYSDKLKTELFLTISAGDKRSFDFSLQAPKKN